MIECKKELASELEMKYIGLGYAFGDVRLPRYTNVDWARSIIDRKNTSGCCFSLISSMISWMSRKQIFLALSKAKEDYIASSMAMR